MKLPGRKKFLLFTLMLFGPGLLLIILSKGEQNFNFLKSIGEIGPYQFYDLDSNVISSKTDAYEIVLFTTIQNDCFNNANRSCRIYPYFIDELFYREYKKSPEKYKGVKIYSIVTDNDGNPVAPNPLLIEEFEKYNSEFWELVIGDPRQVYGFSKEGKVFSDVKNEETGEYEFVRMGVLVTDKNQIKAIRPLDGEAFVREFNERFRLVLKEKKIKEYNENR
jgi:hypothetical protein